MEGSGVAHDILLYMQVKKLVIGNWKMNPESLVDAKKIISGVKRSASKFRKVKTIICPSFLHVIPLASLNKSGVEIGAQDVFWEREGSYTGEVSPVQLGKEKIKYCIVGHSERREMGEKDEDVNKKLRALLKVGISPILCIGEKERDHDGFYLAYIRDQLKQALKGVKPKELKEVVIAYEPIWAIGKKGEDAIDGPKLYQMSLYIRKVLSDLYNKKVAFEVPVLYGGSVDEFNSEKIIKEGEVQGFLVGRASLDSKSFLKIIEIVNKA